MNHQEKALTVDANLILRYLQTRKWNVKSYQNGMKQLTIDEGAFEIFLTSSGEESSRKEEVFFALRTISDYYDREVTDVIRDVLSHLSDRISSRIPDDYVRNESIELRVALDYVSGMKALLSSSATTEITENRSFQRTLKEAISFAEQCRFGHTFKSSFGFVIESPVGVNNTPALPEIEEDLPLGRRVVERISTGLRHIESASKSGDTSFITNEESGLSSNMCEALADLLEGTEVSSIKFDIDLSKEWKSALSDEGPKHFKIAQNDVEIIRAGAKSLRSEEVPTSETIYGRIRSVGTDGDPSNLTEDKAKREIELNWINSDDKLIHVKMLVSPEEYLIALEAHKNGKIVTVRGLLPSTGKTRWMGDRGVLRVLEQ